MIKFTGTELLELTNRLKTINQLREFPYIEDLNTFVFYSPWIGESGVYLPLCPKKLVSHDGNELTDLVCISDKELQNWGLSDSQITQIHRYGGLCQYEGTWYVISKDALRKIATLVEGVNPVIAKNQLTKNSGVYVDMLNMALLGVYGHDLIAHVTYPSLESPIGEITNFTIDNGKGNNFVDENGKYLYTKILTSILTELRTIYPKAHFLRWIQMDEYFFVYFEIPELLERNEFSAKTHLRPTLQITWSLDGKLSFQVAGALYSPTFDIGAAVTPSEKFYASTDVGAKEFGLRIVRHSSGIYTLNEIMHKLLQQTNRGTHIREDHMLEQSGIPKQVGKKAYCEATKQVQSELFSYRGKREKHFAWQMLLNQLTPLFYLELHPNLSATSEGVSSKDKNLFGVFSRFSEASRMWGQYLLDS